jgi:hypothetical protein
MDQLRIFIGYDSKEPAAYHTLAHSILSRASEPVAIIPLVQPALRRQCFYNRERTSTESTEFSMTRFLVPFLSGYHGYSVFMDCDMLCRVDIAELWPEIIQKLYWGGPKKIYPPAMEKAVLVCQHDYTPKESTKFLGQQQIAYPRKNWSSFMVFANNNCRKLTPDYVSSASGLELHRFQWTTDDKIGSLPLEWNWLVGDYAANPDAKILHFTQGGPWFPGYQACDHADEWFAERESAFS